MRYKPETKKWNIVVPGLTYKICCCDCGLVHDYVYQLTKKREIYVSTKRNERSTGQVRRHMKK